MVPDAFHDYFVASAGVAGALIGLLFVAISVHPEQIGESGDASTRFRPSAALSALVNALLVSLIVLIPDERAANGVIAVGAIGLAAVGALLIGLVPEFWEPPRLPVARGALLLVGQGIAFGYEVYQGARLRRGEDPLEPLQGICLLVLVLFAIGIERAWEFVGAKMPGPLGAMLAVNRTVRERRRAAALAARRGTSDVG